MQDHDIVLQQCNLKNKSASKQMIKKHLIVLEFLGLLEVWASRLGRPIRNPTSVVSELHVTMQIIADSLPQGFHNSIGKSSVTSPIQWR